MVLFVSFAILAQTTAAEEFLTLKETIEIALSENLQLKTSKEQTLNAIAMKNVSRSHLLPTFNIAYHYQRNDKAFISQGGIIEPENAYTFATTLKQPLFAGFSFKNRYAISQLQVDVAKNNEKLTRLDIVLSAQKIYFSLLKAQKMAAIAREAVIQIASHEKVANHFYQAGMVPLNDLLESQVELANTRQILINADNNLEIAKASFNTLLRRTINAPVMIEDITEFESFEHDFAFCLSAAKKNRQELKTNDLEIKATEYDLEISKKKLLPDGQSELVLYSAGRRLGCQRRHQFFQRFKQLEYQGDGLLGSMGFRTNLFWNKREVGSRQPSPKPKRNSGGSNPIGG
jgi:outer membrane protein